MNINWRCFVDISKKIPSFLELFRNTIYNPIYLYLQYTIWNFIPKNLFEQFRRVANFYFLLTMIIALTIESSMSLLTSALPLAFVTLVTACKQGYEDYLRYKTDKRDNRRSVNVIRNKCTQVRHACYLR